MILKEIGQPLELSEVPDPIPTDGQILVKIEACAVCRTDLHILDGELPYPKLPLIMGHQIVGENVITKERVGIPWLGKTCGQCLFCLEGKENLCDAAQFTGYDLNGGFAEFCVANKEFVFPLPHLQTAEDLAPLLCAGMIGYRSLKMAGDAKKIGFYGFGQAAHLLIQVAKAQGKEVYAFTRKGDLTTQEKARSLGAVYTGDSETMSPDLLDAAILFAPVGLLVPQALRNLRKGGKVVCAGIHMSDIPSFPYEILWGERSVCSVANLTRQDGSEFLELSQKLLIETDVTPYPLEKTNEALRDLREGAISGSAVIIPS